MENKLGKYLRQRRGKMSLREFAARCNISHTHLDSIEKGADPRTGKRVSVSTETLRLIADGIGVDYLFLACLADGVDPTRDLNIRIPDDYAVKKPVRVNLELFSNTENQTDFTIPEIKMVKKYRTLDEYGKDTVSVVLDCEARRCSEQRASEANDEEPAPRIIPLYLSAPAAGIASPILGEDYDDYELRPNDPRDAVFAVRVQGDSMEPDFPDGSIAFCSRKPLENGDIGVFAIDGGSVIKQYVHDDVMGMTYLFSLNRARSDADVLILPSSGQSLTCQGRVITSKRYPFPR